MKGCYFAKILLESIYKTERFWEEFIFILWV